MPQEPLNALVESVRTFQVELLFRQLIASINELRPKAEPILVRAGLPFAAALGGALGAFFLNWSKESRKQKAERNAAINEVLLIFATNVEMLVNFKFQFLEQFAAEIAQMGAHASRYGTKLPPEELSRLKAEWEQKLRPRVQSLAANYADDPDKAGLGGLLKRSWEVPPLVEVDVNKIGFVSEQMPVVVRTAMFANAKLKTFLTVLEDRHGIWKEAAPVFETDLLFEAAPKFMRYLFELIDSRQTLFRHAGDALALMHACTICLSDYQDREFPKRGKLARRFLQSFPRVRVTLVGPAISSMPRPRLQNAQTMIASYAQAWFEPHFELIRSRWLKAPEK